MKRIAGIASVVVVVVVAALALVTARAADLSQPVILVASQGLAGSPFEQAVVIATPLPNGGHIGFIVNRPTTVDLEAFLPDDAKPRGVKEPVYYGGPELTRGLFALMRNAPDVPVSAIPLLPGVVAIVDPSTVDHLIETMPNAARYFVGMMVWDAGELAQQVTDGVWDVHPADADSVLPADAPRLWSSLTGPMATIDRSSLD